MFNIYICEDNEQVRNEIKRIVLKSITEVNLNINEIMSTDSCEEIIRKSRGTSNNIYLLDIVLKNEMNGLILAKEIRKYDLHGNIIFITSHLELSLKTFQYKLKALDYICKDDDIQKRVVECFKIIKREEEDREKEKNIFIKSGSSYYNVLLDEIICFETSTQVRKIILHSTTSKIEFYDTLSNLEEKLDLNFIRCHRAFIINRKHLSSLTREKGNYIAVMKNGEKCMVSKKYVKLLRGNYE